MSKYIIVELAILLILFFLLMFVLNPFNIFMPSMTVALTACIALFVLLVLTTFFWKERSTDERDDFHRARATQLSFFTGASILTLGILVNLLQHSVDPWLLLALAAMVGVKIASRIYLQVSS